MFGASPADSGQIGDLYGISPAGGTPLRLTTAGDAWLPRVSPDGRLVLFARQQQGDAAAGTSFSLWLLDLATGEQRPLTPAVPGHTDLPGSWSPDGTAVAFTRYGPATVGARGRVSQRRAIWLVGADGAGARELGEGSAPAFSPDGTRIAFVSGADRNGELCAGEVCSPAGELYVMAADGSGVRRLTRSGAGEDAPAWSADGSALAFERTLEAGNALARSVWIATADGACAYPLGRDRSRTVTYSGPSWRPGSMAPAPCAPGRGVDAARRAPLEVPGLTAARRSRGYPLVWLGPEFRGRRLTTVLHTNATVLIYGDCAVARAGDDCRAIQLQVFPVCAVPPPLRRQLVPQPFPVRRGRVGDAVTFSSTGHWALYTGSLVVRGFFTGRLSGEIMRSLRGLNARGAGVRPGRPLPSPARGVLEGTLPCQR